MPLHDVGYRSWQGTRRGSLGAILVIAMTGIRLAWTSRWLRRAVFFAWSPALVFAGSFFAFEQAVDEGRLAPMKETARGGANLDGVGILGAVIAQSFGEQPAGTAVAPDPHAGPKAEADRIRRAVWSRLLLAFMRAPQAILLAVVVGLVAPALVSRDLRAKAWLIYFTRPVGKLEYVLGKLLILGLLVATITMLPGLALWGMGVAVSPSIAVALTTWDLPLRIIAASVALAVPTILMALAFSSLTAESRIATFAWFATWAACWIAHTSLTAADILRENQNRGAQTADRTDGAAQDPIVPTRPSPNVRPPRRQPDMIDMVDNVRKGRPIPNLRHVQWISKAAGLDPAIDRWAWLSPYHALGVIQAWIFGIETRWKAVMPPLVSLCVVSALSAAVLWWRVDAPARV